MASRTCLRCMSRLRISSPSNQSLRHHGVPAASFSTTANLEATNPQKGSGSKLMRKTLNVSRGNTQRQKTYKPPPPGERKAIRKRVVLSNTNAFEVDSLTDIDVKNFANEDQAGQMIGLPNDLIDNLRAIDAFKPSQGWGFFRRPASLVRKETLEVAKFISSHTSGAEVFRRVVAGERGSGKSVLLLQAQAMAFLKQWVVIHLPEAFDLSNASTAYAPLPPAANEPVSYAQRRYVASLLSAIAKANAAVLNTLTTTREHAIGKPLQSNLTLTRLCEAGAADLEVSWEVFLALWAELSADGRPPVLFTLDGLAHVSRFSEYLSQTMHHIHAHDLSIVGHFMKCLSGETAMPNGGMVLAADSRSNRPTNPALDFSILTGRARSGDAGVQHIMKAEQAAAVLEQKADRSAVLFDPNNPYQVLDQRTLRALLGVEVMYVPGLNKDEARAVLEYYAKSGMLRATVTEALVARRWTTSGGGIVGEIEKASVRSGF